MRAMERAALQGDSLAQVALGVAMCRIGKHAGPSEKRSFCHVGTPVAGPSGTRYLWSWLCERSGCMDITEVLMASREELPAEWTLASGPTEAL